MFERKSTCPANTTHCITFIQRRPSVFDVSPTLYKVIQMFCVHWVSIYKLGVNQFRHPRSNTVSLFATQRPSRGQGFEFLTHRCRSSIYEVAVIRELALNEALGMKRIFNIIVE